MSSRRQSIRVSSQTLTVNVSKTSVGSMSISLSTPKSAKRTRNIFSQGVSSTEFSSPQWISGSDFVLKTPKSPVVSRRSTMHQDKKTRNDLDFKIPSLMFSSPPGVKTRSRRSSIYQSSQQGKTITKVPGQQKGWTAVKRVGKTTEGKKKGTQITAAKVASTDVSLVISKAGKAEEKLSGAQKNPQGRSRSARSSSRSESKSLEISFESSTKKSSSAVSSKKKETKSKKVVSSVIEIVTGSSEVKKEVQYKTIATPPNVKSEKSLKRKKTSSPKRHGTSHQRKSTPSPRKHGKSPQRKATPSPKRQGKSPQRKATPSPKRQGKSQSGESPPTKSMKSVRRKSNRLSRSMTVLAQDEKTSASISVLDIKTSVTPRKTPSPRAKSRSKSSKVKEDEEKSPKVKKAITPKRQDKRSHSSKSKASPEISKRTPRQRATDTELHIQEKQETSRTPEQPLKVVSQKSKKSASQKRTTIQREKKIATSSQQQKAETPQTIKKDSIGRTPVLRIQKISPLVKKVSPLKGKSKSPSSSKVNSPKRTPSRREKIRILSSIETATSSSTTVIKSPQSQKSNLSKRISSQRVKSVTISDQEKLDTPTTSKQFSISKQGSTGRSPVLRIKKVTISPAQKDSSVKGKQKSPAVKSTPRRDLNTPRRTPTHKEKVRILSSHERQVSSSTTVAKSPSVISSDTKVNVTLRKTPYQSVTSRPLRTANLNIVEKDSRGARYLSGNFSATRTNSDKLVSVLSPHNSTPQVSFSKHIGMSAFTKTMPSSVSPLTKITDVSVRRPTSEAADLARSQRSSRWTENTYAVSPLVTSSKTTTREKSSLISSRESLSVSRGTKRSFIPLEKTTSSVDFVKTAQVRGKESREVSVESEESLSTSASSSSSLRKRKYESEAEEINRMVSTMVKAGLPKKLRSMSPAIKAPMASPARITIMREREANADAGTAQFRTLRVTRDITPSIAAPKARKVLGVSDSSSTTSTETSSQTYSTSQGSESSYKRIGQYEYSSYKMGTIGRRLDLHRDEEDEYGTSTGSDTVEVEEASIEEEDASVQDEKDVTETETETDEDDADDRNITLSHTSHSQRCTIS